MRTCVLGTHEDSNKAKDRSWRKNKSLSTYQIRFKVEADLELSCHKSLLGLIWLYSFSTINRSLKNELGKQITSLMCLINYVQVLEELWRKANLEFPGAFDNSLRIILRVQKVTLWHNRENWASEWLMYFFSGVASFKVDESAKNAPIGNVIMELRST